MSKMRNCYLASFTGCMLLQGKAACEITTADELLATEMMFNGTFNSLDKHQLASLVSCLVPVDKSNVSRLRSCTNQSQRFIAYQGEFLDLLSNQGVQNNYQEGLAEVSSRFLQEQVKLTTELAEPLRSLQDAAKHIASLSLECKLEMDSGNATCVTCVSEKKSQTSTIGCGGS